MFVFLRLMMRSNFVHGEHILDVVETFTYLGSIVATKLPLDIELNARIGKASAAMSRLVTRL